MNIESPRNIPGLTLSGRKRKDLPIFHIERQNTQGSISEPKSADQNSDLIVPCDSIRVGASSKVNFSKLSLTEQWQRFKNQQKEIRRLKKLLRKYQNEKEQYEELLLKGDKEGQQTECSEQRPQEILMKGLSEAVAEGKLKPNTFGYNQVCTILRDLLDLPCIGNGFAINLPEKPIPISSVEYETYLKLSCTKEILRVMVGRKRKRVEKPEELVQFQPEINIQQLIQNS